MLTAATVREAWNQKGHPKIDFAPAGRNSYIIAPLNNIFTKYVRDSLCSIVLKTTLNAP
jgi:hypothetical protein